ncbi:MAG: hypothetical protein EOM18_17370 [Clostridia bacterium]|nr:hypothetical protein [Clostridia bacterium]
MNGIFTGTFHSFAFHLLRKYRDIYMEHFSFTSFPELITEEDKKSIIKKIIYNKRDQFLGIPSETVFRLSCRLEKLDSITVEKLKKSGIYEFIKQIPQAYKEHKNKEILIDFDDMISHAAFLLQMNITLDSGEILSCFSEFGSWVMMVSATTSATIYSGAVKKNEYKKNGWIMSDKDFYDIYHKEDWRVFCDELPAYREHNPHHFDQYSTAYYDVLELASPGGILKAQKIQPIRARLRRYVNQHAAAFIG